jgi:diacylglycerol kinase (ATP)
VKYPIEHGVDAIVVCGGDGTVFDVLQGLAGSEIPLGLIPFGTGNILAQNLHIPNKSADSARWLLGAKPRRVPLGKINLLRFRRHANLVLCHSCRTGCPCRHDGSDAPPPEGPNGTDGLFRRGRQALFSHPVQPFEMKIKTVEGKILERRASEVIAVRVAALNLWRAGGDLGLPFLRLASVEGESRWRLAKASF